MNKLLKKIVVKLVVSIIIFVTFVYITTLICSIPKKISINVVDNHLKVTHSYEQILNIANEKFLCLLKGNLGTYQQRSLASMIMPYILRSLALLLCGLILGIVIGVLKGIVDSRRKNKETTAKLLLSIIPLSFPDILIIAALQYLAIWLNKHGIKIVKAGGTGGFTYLILPVIALALPAACYIARITAISIEECYSYDYIKTAVGKGCSDARILWNHVMKNAVGIIVQSLTNITSMIICNMLIVEYLFAYQGLTALLIKLITKNDQSSLTSVVMVIGIIYLILDNLIHLAKLCLSKPLKEESA